MLRRSIILMTATGQGNLGDELILIQELRLIQSVVSDTVYVYSHDIDRTKIFLRDHDIDMRLLRFRNYVPNQIRKKPIQNICSFG